MRNRYCATSRTVSAFIIALFLIVYFPQGMSAGQISINQIDTKQSIAIMDGVEVRVQTPYVFVERAFVYNFERGLTISMRNARVGDRSIDKLVNVTLDMDLTEIYRKQFRLLFFEPIEYELWKNGKPAKPLAEKDCDWRCRVVLNLGDRRYEDEIYLVALNKDEQKHPLNIVTRYVLRLYALLTVSEMTYLPKEGLNGYWLALPVYGDGYGEVRVRFQSNVPVKIVVKCYNERSGTDIGTDCYTAEGREGAFSFKVDLYSKYYLPRVQFLIYNRERVDARIKLWGEFSWVSAPNLRIVDWYGGDEPGKIHERTLRLQTRYVERNSSRESVIWLGGREYRRSIDYYTCPETGFDKFLVETEEPSGAKYRLLVLNSYDSKIFWTHANKIGYLRDPSDILPLLKPLAEAGPTSKARIDLSNLKECPDVVFIRAENGTIGIRYKLLTKWTEVSTHIGGSPREWIVKIPFSFGRLLGSLLNPLRVEGEFKAERPVNFLIVNYDDFSENRGIVFYEARNAESGRFSFYKYGGQGIMLIGENLGWEPTEIKVWIRYEPVQGVAGAKTITETRVVTQPLRTTTTTTPKKTTTIFTSMTQTGTFTDTTAATTTDAVIQIILLAGVGMGVLAGFIIASRRRAASKSGGMRNVADHH